MLYQVTESRASGGTFTTMAERPSAQIAVAEAVERHGDPPQLAVAA